MKRFLAVSGLLGGLFWITLRFFPPQCAQVTEQSEVLCNRLWSPALFAMLLGFIGLFLTVHLALSRFAWAIFFALPLGLCLMFLGNSVEYWALSDLPHEGPAGFARGLAWMTVLIGLLIVLLASILAGFLGFRSGVIPVWLSSLLVLLLPMTLVTGFVNINFAGMPLGVVSVAVGLSGLFQRGTAGFLARRG